MKKLRIIFCLLAMLSCMTSMAQSSDAEYRIYKNGEYWGSYYVDYVDSIVYKDVDYDINVSVTDPTVEANGTPSIIVSYSGGFSVAKVKAAIVPNTYTDADALSAYMQGKLNLRDITGNKDNVFTIDDKDYKAIVFAYDASGQYRSYALSGETGLGTLGKNLINLLNDTSLSNTRHSYFGYGTIMHSLDLLGEDMCTNCCGYDWFMTWEKNGNYANYGSVAEMLYYFMHSIKSLNGAIECYSNRHKVSTTFDKYLGEAYCLRAMHNLDAARIYEFLPNDKTTSVNEYGNDVTGLTFPIITTTDDSMYVERANRVEMEAFIIKDLNAALQYLKNVNEDDKGVPSEAFIYGLLARTYLWSGDYDLAKSYAEKVINMGYYSPLTQNEWLNTTEGFNKACSSWIMSMHYVEEQANLTNWVSWCANENEFGYSSLVPTMIGKSIYDRIADTDFRKLSYKAPYGSSLYGQEPYINQDIYNSQPDYTSLKFRPGQGNTSDYAIACNVDIPLMRVEEMYFIKSEAEARLGDVQTACKILTDFMRTYRDVNYSCQASTLSDYLNEMFLQKRIEFWGEGLNFYDYKRLNMPVTRGYNGTNFVSSTTFNTTTRPAWMNVIFSTSKTRPYNKAFEEWNNPLTVGLYDTNN